MLVEVSQNQCWQELKDIQFPNVETKENLHIQEPENREFSVYVAWKMTEMINRK